MNETNRKFTEENGIPVKRISEEIEKAETAQRWRLSPSDPITVKFKRLHPNAIIPTQAYEGDAGFDLYAVEDTIIEPGETALIKTGLAVQLPPGYEMQIRPRSGISLKTKLRVANAPGTVDASFRGEIVVIVDNIAEHPYEMRTGVFGIDGDFAEHYEKYYENSYLIRKGDRIAQGVLQRVPTAEFIEVDELDETERGEDGFGSSGVNG